MSEGSSPRHLASLSPPHLIADPQEAPAEVLFLNPKNLFTDYYEANTYEELLLLKKHIAFEYV